MKAPIVAALFGLGLALLPAGSQAGNVSGTLSIKIQPALAISFAPTSPTVDCTAAPGTVVAAISTSGGNGNAATPAITGGNSTDFAISGSNIVVAANGIASANCGKTQSVTITATQQ